jgi:transposase
MLRPSFVPPAEIRLLRDLTRYRTDLVRSRTAEKQRVEKLLEDAQIKLSVVASDIFGVSGREMMAALIAGERDPEALAQLARSRMRAKITLLEEAFVGHFTNHHRFLLTTMPARINQTSADIAAVETRIGQLIAPFAQAVDKLDEITGVGITAAHVMIAEIGVDMSRFPTAAHLCSWARFAPRGHRVRREEQGTRCDRARQPLPRPGPGRGRRHRQQDRHLPRRALPAHRAAAGHEEGHCRGRTFHPGHHLASAV